VFVLRDNKTTRPITGSGFAAAAASAEVGVTLFNEHPSIVRPAPIE
jgi:hypothetical protein